MKVSAQTRTVFEPRMLSQVVGLDFAQDMLDDADSRQTQQSASRRNRQANIEWVQGDAMELPFPDCSFHAATMGYGLRNVPDALQAFKVSTEALC